MTKNRVTEAKIKIVLVTKIFFNRIKVINCMNHLISSYQNQQQNSLVAQWLLLSWSQSKARYIMNLVISKKFTVERRKIKTKQAD